MKGLQKFGRSEYRNVGKYQKELKTTKPYPIQKKKDNFLLQVKKTSLTNFIQKSIFEYIDNFQNCLSLQNRNFLTLYIK